MRSQHEAELAQLRQQLEANAETQRRELEASRTAHLAELGGLLPSEHSLSLLVHRFIFPALRAESAKLRHQLDASYASPGHAAGGKEASARDDVRLVKDDGAPGSSLKALYNGSIVAFKRLGAAGKSDLFMAEAQKLQAAIHPRLARFFGVVQLAGEPHAVMEGCGTSFSQLLPLLGSEREGLAGYLTMKRIVSWILNVAQGMQALHQLNLIHRELAVRNVVVGPMASQAVLAWVGDTSRPLPDSFDVRLCDFGLTLALEGTKQPTTPPGFELDYMHASPELLQYKRSRKEADVWAFAIVCWEVVAFGADPFAIQLCDGGETREDRITTLIKVLTVDKYRPSLDDPNLIEFELPAGFKALVAACWDEVATRRPKFADIVQRLEVIARDRT
jgi:serine/threonine protein kinase